MKFYNSRGKEVGVLGEDGKYRSKRKGSKHILKIMDAWGIDSAIVEKLEQNACSEIRILDEETNTVYSATLETLRGHSVERDFDGRQLFLSRKYWTYEKK